MYQRKDKKFKWELFFKTTLVLAIAIGCAAYYIINQTLVGSRDDFALFFDGFDVEPSLIDEENINYTLIDQRAQQFEELLGKYHIPRNMTGEKLWDMPWGKSYDVLPPTSVLWDWANDSWVYWNNTELLAAFDPLDENDPHNNRTEMTYSGDMGHTSLYEGIYLAGEAFRYAVAKRNHNGTEKFAALDRIKELVVAYKILSEVSGMGAWCRYAIPDTPEAHRWFGNGFFTTADNFNVTYKDITWTIARHISRDVYCGVTLGLTMVYALVDDEDVREVVGDIIDTTVQWLYDCNWRIVDVDGTQHVSADMISSRPLIDGSWLIYYLQMGKLVNEKKWGPIYKNYVYDRGVAENLGRSMRMGIDLAPKVYDAYYGCNFIYYSSLCSIFLCDDEELREIYTYDWLNVMHDFCKLHRNGFFDAVWLLCHTKMQDDIYDKPEIELTKQDLKIWKNANIKKPDDLDYIQEFCVRDIKDCLQRYAERKYPNRNYYYATKPDTFPNEHQQEIPYADYPKYDYWEPKTSLVDLITDVLTGAGREVTDPGLFDNALPVDIRPAEDMMFQRRSFCVEDTESLQTNPGNFEVTGGPEYLAMYWIAKYLDII